MNKEALLQANVNLNKKLSKLQKVEEENFLLSQQVAHRARMYDELHKRWNDKQSIARVALRKGKNLIALKIVRVQYSVGGILLEVVE